MKPLRAEALLLAISVAVASGCGEDVTSPGAEPALAQAARPLQEQVRMLKDLNPDYSVYGDEDSRPTQYVRAGAFTYFVATTTRAGTELWRTDGTEAGTLLLKDIAPGLASSNPSNLTAVGGTLFFTATSPATGNELWKTDGTEAGTVLVKDTLPGATPGSFSALAAVGNTLYFGAESKGLGVELWKSDGTEAGTVLVKDLYTGSTSGNPSALTAMGGVLYFRASSSDGYGTELWRSDGTSAGTSRVKDLYPGSGSGGPTQLTAVGGTLYFQATNGTSGYELWRSDGTAAGTVLVKDLNPGSASSSPQRFVELGGTVFFTATDATSGTELWRTDGTAAGTVLVKDIHPGSASASPGRLTVLGGTLLFAATEPTAGRELWRTDGTEAGTFLVKDVIEGSSNGNPDQLTVVNERLFFSDNWGSLYSSDGTAAGTVRVDAPGVVWGSSDVMMGAVGNQLLYTGSGPTGYEPWKTDGTAAGTALLKELQPATSNATPSQFTRAGNTVFFRARAPGGFVNYFSVYQTDGTEAGTTVLGDPYDYNYWEPRPLAVLNGTALFMGYSGGGELWRSEGTGAVMVKDINTGGGSDPQELTVLGHAVYFAASDGASGRELWKSDGTEAGTVRVKDIAPGAAGSSLGGLVTMNEVLYFNASDSTGGYELWRSDGTDVGTSRVKDINAGSSSSHPTGLTVVGNTLYFAAGASGQGTELWKSDGTAAGTVLVKDIVSGSVSSSPTSLTAVDSTLFFVATDAAGGAELWKSDGTAAGTVRVKDIYPGVGGSQPRFLTAVNQRLFFGASTPGEGYELWTSDGTEAGTVLVKDLRPGLDSGLVAEPLVALGPEGLLVFSATDGVSGLEPWLSDGTPAGTRQLVDLVPGAGSSVPGNYLRNNQLLYFSADDGVHGREPWVYSLAPVSDTTPPTLTCPASVVAEATGPSGASVSYPPATATDDNRSGAPTLAYSMPSGSLFPQGTTAVTVTATDLAGNQATCTFPVRVRDTTAPTIACPADVTAEATGPDGARVDFPSASAADLASSPSLSYSRPRGSLFPLGATTVTATATDGAGLRASCTFQVMVVDTTAPTLTCPANVVAAATSPSGAPVTYPPAFVLDAATLAPRVISSQASGSLFPLGTTAVTVTAVDSSGNRASCTFTVTVTDLEPPTVACPAPVSVQATSASGALVRYPPATASDAQSPVSLGYSQASGTAFPLGVTPVTVTATDSAGNTATCTFSVSVQDALPPLLNCPASLTAEATDAYGAQVTYPAATATDATPVTLAYSRPSGTTFPLGFNRVTVTATDAAGNSASCSFTVMVRDSTAPTLTCPFNITAEATDAHGVSVAYPSADASDAVTAQPFVVYSKDAGSTFTPGQTRVTVMATDESGNAATCNFYVTVRDTTAPTIACPANLVAEATGSTGAPVYFAAAVASDAVTLSPSVTYSRAPGSLFPPGTTAVTASATDTEGNGASCTFTVTVRDTQAPALTCPANVVAQATSASGAAVTYPAATVSEGISTATVTYSTPSGATFPLGARTVTATATDAAGNRSTCAFSVTVVDAASPTLTCPAHVVAEATDGTGATVTFPQATASDLLAVSQSASPASGSRLPVGTSAVTVTATDAAGNSSLCTFTVQVRDTTAPSLACPGALTTDATGPAGAVVGFPSATASDAVTVQPDVTYSRAPGTLFPVGTTTVSAVARDAAGNAATCTFDVVVRPSPNE